MFLREFDAVFLIVVYALCNPPRLYQTKFPGTEFESQVIFIQSLLYITQKLGLFGTLKLALALQFIDMNAYFSVARTLTLVLHAILK